MGHKEQYQRLKTALLKDCSICKPNRDLFKKFFEWEQEKLKRMNNLSKLDEANYKTLKDYPNRFRNVNSWFENKDWKKLTSAEIRKVYNDLEDGKIKNRNGKKFGDSRSYVNKIFKAKPFGLAGLKEKVSGALEFYVDKREKKEVRFINYIAFDKLVSCINKPQHLALMWLEWDIGENINAVLKLKKKHFKKQLNKDLDEDEYLIFLPTDILKRTRRQRREPTLYPETVKYLDIALEGLKEEDLVFPFGYRQALKLFDSAVKKSKVRCEPHGEKPSWKDLRSGMACHLFEKGWHLEDINLRLGHSPQSRWLESYVNYLATNRKRAKKEFHANNIQDIKEQLKNAKQREKVFNLNSKKQEGMIKTLAEEIEELQKIMLDQAGHSFKFKKTK